MNLISNMLARINRSQSSTSSVLGLRVIEVAKRLKEAVFAAKSAFFGSTATSSDFSSKPNPSNPTEESLVTKEIDNIIRGGQFGNDTIDLGDNRTLSNLFNNEVFIPKGSMFSKTDFEKNLNITFDDFASKDSKQLSFLSDRTNIHVKTLELMQAVSRTYNSQSKNVSGYLVDIFQRLVNSGCPKAEDGKLFITTGNARRDIEISRQVKVAEQETNTQTFEKTFQDILNRFNPKDKKLIQDTFSKIKTDPEDIEINQKKSEDMDLVGVDKLLSKLLEPELICAFEGDPSNPVQLSLSMEKTLYSVVIKLERQLKDALRKNEADHNGILSAFQSDIQKILSNSISNAKKGKGVSFELVKDLKSKKMPAMKELAALLAVFSPNQKEWDKAFSQSPLSVSQHVQVHAKNLGSPPDTSSQGSPPSSPRSVVVDLGSFFPIAQAASAKEQADEARAYIQDLKNQEVNERLDARDKKREFYKREVQERKSAEATRRGLVMSVDPLGLLDQVVQRASRELFSIADQFGVEARKITIESLNKLLPARRSRPVTEDDLDRLEEKQEKRDLKNMLQTREGVYARKLIYDEVRFKEFSEGLKNIERDLKVLYRQERTMSPGDIQREVGKILNKHSIYKEDQELYKELLFLWQR